MLYSGERPEWIAHCSSFLVSNLSDSLISLIKKEGMSESLVFLKTYNKKTFFKRSKNTILFNFLERIARFLWAKEQMSDSLKNKRMIRSFADYHEWPEQMAYGRSLVMSDLSVLLAIAYLSWAIWANCSQSLIKMSDFEQMSDEWMS